MSLNKLGEGKILKLGFNRKIHKKLKNKNISIYIDGLFYRGSGIGRVYSSILKHLVRTDVNIITCVPKRYSVNFASEFGFYLRKNDIVYFVNYEKFSLKGFILNSLLMKELESVVDVFLFPHINLPLYVPKNLIVIIHDNRPFTNWWDRNATKRYILKYHYKRAIEKSKKLIFISDTIKRESLNIFPNLKYEINTKASIIYNFIDDLFLSSQQDCENFLRTNYILFVGNRKKYKNIENLIKAFHKIKDLLPNYKLVIVGKKENDSIDYLDILIRSLDLQEKVICFTKLQDKDLVCIYRYADLLVLPSFYEGFGLTPLEAVSQGCPFILSDIPVFKEIYGDSTVFFDPYDIDDIANKILSVIKNKDLKLLLVDRQKSLLNKFKKELILDQYLKVISEVANGD